MRDDLFAIDIDAEIRKLSKRLFKEEGEHFVELIRFAASLGPDQIDVALNRRGLVIQSKGAHPGEALIDKMSMVFDETRSDDRRHRALVAIEKSYGLGILAAFAGQPQKVMLTWTDSGQPKGIEIVEGQKPRRVTSAPKNRFEIAITSRIRNHKKMRRLIERRCRYSPIPICVNNTPLLGELHLDECIIQVALKNDRMHGVVGLPFHKDVQHITRLSHGIVNEKVVYPAWRGLVLSAIVEEQDQDFQATKATLKRAVERLLKRLKERYENFPGSTQERILELLFERYKNTGDESLLSDVHAFLTVDGPPLDLVKIKEIAKGGSILAIDLDSPIDAYEIGDKPVLRLSGHNRQFLNDVGRIRLVPPPSRICRKKLRDGLGAQIRDAAKWISNLLGSVPGQPISKNLLDANEVAFLDALKANIEPMGSTPAKGDEQSSCEAVDMTERQRSPWVRLQRKGKPATYRLARSHPKIRAMMDAFQSNPLTIYPALALITDGQEGYPVKSKQAPESIGCRAGIEN